MNKYNKPMTNEEAEIELETIQETQVQMGLYPEQK
jgi:hypothetical protein